LTAHIKHIYDYVCITNTAFSVLYWYFGTVLYAIINYYCYEQYDKLL